MACSLSFGLYARVLCHLGRSLLVWAALGWRRLCGLDDGSLVAAFGNKMLALLKPDG